VEVAGLIFPIPAPAAPKPISTEVDILAGSEGDGFLDGISDSACPSARCEICARVSKSIRLADNSLMLGSDVDVLVDWY
jgi:hypothetical protein